MIYSRHAEKIQPAAVQESSGPFFSRGRMGEGEENE